MPLVNVIFQIIPVIISASSLVFVFFSPVVIEASASVVLQVDVYHTHRQQQAYRPLQCGGITGRERFLLPSQFTSE